MGTNYYIHPHGEHHDNPDHWIHLGKASAGLPFMFRAWPEGCPLVDGHSGNTPVMDSYEWLHLLSYGKPFDEYGVEVSADFMRGMVNRKVSKVVNIHAYDHMDRLGNHFIIREFS